MIKFKLDLDDFFFKVILVMLIPISVISIIKFVFFMIDRNELVMSNPEGRMNMLTLSDEFYLNENCDDEFINIKTINSEKNTVFVIENNGFSFGGIENYSIYRKVVSPVSMFAKSSLYGHNLDYKTIFDAYLDEKNWEDIGVHDDILKGKVKINVVFHTNTEKEILKEFFREVYPSRCEKLINDVYHGASPVDTCINVAFAYSIPKKLNYREVKTNLPVKEAQCIIYKTLNEKYEEFHLKDLNGFSEVDEFSDSTNILTLFYEKSDEEVIIENKVVIEEEIKESEEIKEETTEETTPDKEVVVEEETVVEDNMEENTEDNEVIPEMVIEEEASEADVFSLVFIVMLGLFLLFFVVGMLFLV